MEHLFCPEHGGAILLALTTAWGTLSCAKGLPKRYRVVREKIHGGYGPRVEIIVYGPYRFLWYSKLIAHVSCGAWDRVTVEESK